MARSTSETCMFCAPNPCTCFEKPKRKAAPKIPAATSKPQPVVSIPEVEPRRAGLMQTSSVRAALEDEKDLKRAVTIFAVSGMLDSAEVTKHIDLLDMSPVEAKLLIWKLRRQEWLAESSS
jgi:hypothetical protein